MLNVQVYYIVIIDRLLNGKCICICIADNGKPQVNIYKNAYVNGLRDNGKERKPRKNKGKEKLGKAHSSNLFHRQQPDLVRLPNLSFNVLCLN